MHQVKITSLSASLVYTSGLTWFPCFHCNRSVLEALPVMDSLTNKLSLIRILRAVMFSEAHLIEVHYQLIFFSFAFLTHSL